MFKREPTRCWGNLQYCWNIFVGFRFNLLSFVINFMKQHQTALLWIHIVSLSVCLRSKRKDLSFSSADQTWFSSVTCVKQLFPLFFWSWKHCQVIELYHEWILGSNWTKFKIQTKWQNAQKWLNRSMHSWNPMGSLFGNVWTAGKEHFLLKNFPIT